MYQTASDQVLRLATTIIIAAASVVTLSPVLQAVAPAIGALDLSNNPDFATTPREFQNISGDVYW
ncbi:MAG: hypothetical protein ACFCVB_08405 [Nodosilinea sp.]